MRSSFVSIYTKTKAKMLIIKHILKIVVVLNNRAKLNKIS